MVEILLFAVLSVYLSYRLWSVLGTRTGQEKQRQWMRPKNNDENIIILPPKNVELQADAVPEIDEVQPFAEQLKIIQKSIKDFTLERFEKGASNAFCAVVQAFAQNDTERLAPLVGPKVLKSFQSAIKDRVKKKETMHIDIKDVSVEIKDVALTKSIAQILVCFTSDQIVTVIDKAGEVIHNANQLTNRMIDRWTFEKDLNDKSLVWLLVKTESLA